MPHRWPGSRVVTALFASWAFVAAAPGAAADAVAPAPAAVVAQGRGFSLALEAFVGQAGGEASELVFDYPLGQKFKISELTWDLEGVALAGVRATLGFGHRVTLSFGVSRAVSEGSGGMVDRDWMYSDLVNPDDIGDDDWTHESRHPNTSVDEGTLLDLRLSLLAWESGPFRVSGLLGVSRDTWSWSARGGTYVYSVDGFRDRTGSFTTPDGAELLVITYEQEYTMPYLGLEVAWAHPVFRLAARVLASPAVEAQDADFHALRATWFDGEFSGGTFLGAGLDATWAFAGRWFATLAAEYRSFSEITGDMTVRTPEGAWAFRDAAGVSLRTALLSVGAGVRF